MFAVVHRAPPTAAACAEFADAGATVFEIDVQLSERGCVVSHYHRLPLTPWERDNWRWRRARGLAQDLLVAEALAVIPATAGVLLDVKETQPARRRALLDALAADLAPDRDRFVVSAPSPADVVAARAHGFRGWRTARNPKALAALLRDGVQADGVSVRHVLLGERAVDALLRQTDAVVAWTVNDEDRARRLRDRGVTGITTDRVGVVRAVAG